jgi:hypothetical protein
LFLLFCVFLCFRFPFVFVFLRSSLVSPSHAQSTFRLSWVNWGSQRRHPLQRRGRRGLTGHQLWPVFLSSCLDAGRLLARPLFFFFESSVLFDPCMCDGSPAVCVLPPSNRMDFFVCGPPPFPLFFECVQNNNRVWKSPLSCFG